MMWHDNYMNTAHKLTINTEADRTIFIAECSFAEKDMVKEAGFRWNRDERRWVAFHVIAVARLIKAYRAVNDGLVPAFTDAARVLFTSETERTSKLPRCGRCAGTGKFITGMVNGQPTGPGGICYRCEGRGHQDARDEERNDNYDSYAAARAFRADMGY